MAEGRQAGTIATFVTGLAVDDCAPDQIESVTIGVSQAYTLSRTDETSYAQISFDKFHVIRHANAAVDRMRRIEQRAHNSLKGLRWSLLQDRASLRRGAAADLDVPIARTSTVRTARARVYKEQLRNMLERWCTCVMRFRVEPMKEAPAMAWRHLQGVVAWAKTGQFNGFLEAIDGLLLAKRRARRVARSDTIRCVIFEIAGRLESAAVNPHDPAPRSVFHIFKSKTQIENVFTFNCVLAPLNSGCLT